MTREGWAQILIQERSGPVPIKLFLKVYLFLRGKSVSGGGKRDGDRGSEAGSALKAERPMQGSNQQTVRSGPEPKSDAYPTEPPRHPRSGTTLKWYSKTRQQFSRFTNRINIFSY